MYLLYPLLDAFDRLRVGVDAYVFPPYPVDGL